MTIKIFFGNKVSEVHFGEPVLLKTVLEKEGFPLSFQCGGMGKCGKCVVRAEGSLSDKTMDESHLSENFRLACKTTVTGDASIFIPETNKLEGIKDIYLPTFARNEQTGYGIATDIGTTTVASYLFDLKQGICVNSICLPNAQIPYGADVISRIDYARKNGFSVLSDLIRSQVFQMNDSLSHSVSKTVVTGNTAMLHFFCGFSTDGMVAAPFTPKTLFGNFYENTYIPLCISPFAGADVTCGILASELTSHKTALLIDIGTNCETVLWHKGHGFCCTSAAGPAFEGAGISCGVPSVSGAINSLRIENGKTVYSTIYGGNPCGICGSGLIDAAACMIDSSFMDSSGYIEKDFPLGDSGYYLTQKDIRQLQLAKSAVMAGIYTLLSRAGTDFDEVEKIYLAGGFGSRLNVASCEKCGLLPKGSIAKTVAIGNAAAAGASMFIMDGSAIEKSREIVENTSYLSLAEDPVFSDAFIRYMSF